MTLVVAGQMDNKIPSWAVAKRKRYQKGVPAIVEFALTFLNNLPPYAETKSAIDKLFDRPAQVDVAELGQTLAGSLYSKNKCENGLKPANNSIRFPSDLAYEKTNVSSSRSDGWCGDVPSRGQL